MTDEEFETDISDLQDEFEEVIESMWLEMGRRPTEEEVVNFVFGSDDERKAILKGS